MTSIGGQTDKQQTGRDDRQIDGRSACTYEYIHGRIWKRAGIRDPSLTPNRKKSVGKKGFFFCFSLVPNTSLDGQQ